MCPSIFIYISVSKVSLYISGTMVGELYEHFQLRLPKITLKQTNFEAKNSII